MKNESIDVFDENFFDELHLIATTLKTGHCTWHESAYDYNIWESECGLTWELIDGTPKENGMNYCPRCGEKIKEM